MEKKNLIIFDVDGTLINSMPIDAKCFVDSLSKDFGIKDINQDWSIYKKVTDSGIFEEIYESAFNKKPSTDDFKKHEDSFFKVLKNEIEANLNPILEISGAKEMLNSLQNKSNYYISIATGTYFKTAMYKLKQININENDFPISTANDDMKREKIIETSIAKAKIFYGIDDFDKIISVGDGSWDLKTAINLDIPFVGIGKSKFKEISNCVATDDYLKQEVFFELLEKSFSPKKIDNI